MQDEFLNLWERVARKSEVCVAFDHLDAGGRSKENVIPQTR